MRTSLVIASLSLALAATAHPLAAAPYLCWSDSQHLVCGNLNPAAPPITASLDVDVVGTPSSVAWSGGRHDTVIRGVDQRVRHWASMGASWSSLGWDDWGTPVAGAALGNPELITGTGNRVVAYVRATTGSKLNPQDRIYTLVRDLSTGAGTWRSLGRPVTYDGTGGVSNVAAAAQSSTVPTAYVHAGGHLWETYSTDAGATYVAWYDLGAPADAPAFDSDPDAASLDASSADVVIHATDGSIRRWQWRAATGTAWSTLPAGPADLRNPTITVDAAGLLVIAVDPATTTAYQWRDGQPAWTIAYPANYATTATDVVR